MNISWCQKCAEYTSRLCAEYTFSLFCAEYSAKLCAECSCTMYTPRVQSCFLCNIQTGIFCAMNRMQYIDALLINSAPCENWHIIICICEPCCANSDSKIITAHESRSLCCTFVDTDSDWQTTG